MQTDRDSPPNHVHAMIHSSDPLQMNDVDLPGQTTNQ
uniref:Uncharacterized protein n=1 Tax=Rhizophora mucronata TaxID=61149 RepID=A0A2P2NLQ3_RHIMU